MRNFYLPKITVKKVFGALLTISVGTLALSLTINKDMRHQVFQRILPAPAETVFVETVVKEQPIVYIVDRYTPLEPEDPLLQGALTTAPTPPAPRDSVESLDWLEKALWPIP